VRLAAGRTVEDAGYFQTLTSVSEKGLGAGGRSSDDAIRSRVKAVCSPTLQLRTFHGRLGPPWGLHPGATPEISGVQ
jgi:hypothetical protein